MTLSMMLQEARAFSREKGLRRTGTWLFLVTLTVLTLLTLGDYLNISTLDPEDFVRADSHVLEIEVERGKYTGTDTLGVQQLTAMCVEYLEQSGLEMDFIPHVTVSADYSSELFLQTRDQEVGLSGFSYVPIEHLDESALLMGRMPQSPQEIVVDRWVLDAVLREDGIVQSSIPDYAFFLGKQLSYAKKNYSPTIVGICDSAEPSLYMTKADLANIGVSSTAVITLSDLQRLIPGEYDDLTLGAGECIAVTNNAGIAYASKIGGTYFSNSGMIFDIADAIEENRTHASFVICDDDVEPMIRSMLQTRFYIYCADKAAVKEYLSGGLPEEFRGQFQITVTDRSSEAWTTYQKASRIQLDGRSIITMTVLMLSVVMLYLLQRARVRERMDTVTVYRLLGIPGRKLVGIFALESVLLFLRSTLPSALVTWLTVLVLRSMPSLTVSVLLPWQAATAVTAALLALHIILSVLPLERLLRLPPAQLAAKYDI